MTSNVFRGQIMNKLPLGISILVILSACDENKQTAGKDDAVNITVQKEVTEPTQQTTNTSVTTGIDTKIIQARAVIRTFAGTLKGELQAGIKAGGPVTALEICNTKAPQIAAKVATEAGMRVSRVSLKNRNTDNTPNVWQKTVLEDFETSKAAGADPTTLEFSEIVEHDGSKEFRFMKAIPTDGVCLACHGESLANDIQETITTLYPDDRATDFKLGDIRGSFAVTKMLY